jgi:hypothetical protein
MASQEFSPNQRVPFDAEEELQSMFAALTHAPLPMMRPEYAHQLQRALQRELAAQAARRSRLWGLAWWRRSGTATHPAIGWAPQRASALRFAMAGAIAMIVLVLVGVTLMQLYPLGPGARVATLHVRAGEVHVARPVHVFVDVGLMRSITVSPGEQTRLRPGDQLVSGPATDAEIALSDGSRALVGSGAQLTIEELQARSASAPLVVAMRLERGEMRSQVEHLQPEKGERFEVRTPTLVARVKGTIFRVDVQSDETRVATDKGVVRVSFAGKAFDIEAGRELMVQLGESVPEVNVRPQPPEISSDVLARADGGNEGASERFFANTPAMRWLIHTLPRAHVVFYVNDAVLQDVVANGDGVATVNFAPAAEGVYRITAVMETSTGERSLPAAVKIVVVDYTPPPLLLTSPTEPQVTTSAVSIAGSTEPGVKLLVNGEPTIVDERGDFKRELILAQGANPITLVATDPAGNSISLQSVIVYEPPAY